MIFGSLFSFCSFSAFTLYIMRKICFLILFCRTDLKIRLRFFGNFELKVSVDRFFLPAVPEYTMKPLIFHGYLDTPGSPLPFYRNAFSVTTIGYFRAIDAVKKRRDNFHGIRRSHGKPAYIAINPCQNAAPEMMIELLWFVVFRAIQKERTFYKNGTQKYEFLTTKLKNENVYPDKARSN